MAATDAQLDEIVYQVIRECCEGDYHPSREEINKLVVDHIGVHVAQYVMKSLPRLETAGQIIADRDSSPGRPHIYYLPKA